MSCPAAPAAAVSHKGVKLTGLSVMDSGGR
jgi:hypothetical protein